MRAAVYERYGAADVVQLREVERPRAGPNEILVQVVATSVTTADWRIRSSTFPRLMWLGGRLYFGLLAPKRKILGSDFSGRVVGVGQDVRRFKAGDEVFGFSGFGAHAEYLAIPEEGVVLHKPANLTHEEAAAVPFGAHSALVHLRDFGRLKAGQKVMVLGASGGVGVFAVQLARHFGAEVTGVCSSANVDLVRELGAHRVIDYTCEDFTAERDAYDLILDAAGITSFGRIRRALKPRGLFLPLVSEGREIAQALLTRLRPSRRVIFAVSGTSRADMQIIADLLERGAIRPVIDQRLPLDRIADAHRRVESRHKRGAVVVQVAGPED